MLQSLPTPAQLEVEVGQQVESPGRLQRSGETGLDVRLHRTQHFLAGVDTELLLILKLKGVREVFQSLVEQPPFPFQSLLQVEPMAVSVTCGGTEQ